MAFVLPPHHHEFQHVHKRFPTRYHDGHASLARETRRDPVDVDTDRASMGWTNWDLAKEGQDREGRFQVFTSCHPSRHRTGHPLAISEETKVNATAFNAFNRKSQQFHAGPAR